MTALLVALGAAAGSALRYLAGHALDGRWPRGTLLVNLLGSLLLGWLSARSLSGDQLALLGTGFCGGFTTFSAFAVQTAELGGRRGTAYAVGTAVGALTLAALGYAVGQA